MHQESYIILRARVACLYAFVCLRICMSVMSVLVCVCVLGCFVYVYVWTDGWTHERTDGCMDVWMYMYTRAPLSETFKCCAVRKGDGDMLAGSALFTTLMCCRCNK